MSKLIKLLPVAALVLSGLATAGTRVADTGVVVRYGDLALNTKQGVAHLHARIRSAAERVCAPVESRILGLRQGYEQCIAAAVAQGVAAVDNDNLTNFHQNAKHAVVASR